jgi:hypothetical protein
MKDENDQLKEAVEEFMGKALREIMEMFKKTEKFPEDPAAYCHEVSELYSQSAEKIRKSLGRDSLLRTPEDVGNIILSEFLPAIESAQGYCGPMLPSHLSLLGK